MLEIVNTVLILICIVLIFVIASTMFKVNDVYNKVFLRYKSRKETDMVVSNKFQNLYS